MTRAQEIADLLSGVTITTADNTTQLTLTSTDADNDIGPQIDLRRDSGSPADSDVLGRVRWLTDDDAGNLVESAILQSNLEDASQGTVDTQLQITTSVASTMRNRMKITSSEVVFNEDSIDSNFRVESNGNANMLFVNGGTDKIGIGVSDADATLDVSGGENKLGIIRMTQRADGAAAYGLDMGLDNSTGDPVFSRIVNDTVTEVFRIQRSSGNVGISTTAPVANLEIEDGGTSNSIITKITADDQNPYALMIGNDSYSTTDTNAFGFLQRNDGAAYIYNAGSVATQISAAGEITKPLQPAFQVRPATVQSNIGVSTNVDIVFGTEIFDVGSNFASNTFTAPVAGKYYLSASIRTESVDSASNYYLINIVTSNRNYQFIFDPDFGQDAGFWVMSISHIADMDASDTAKVQIVQQSGTQQTDITTESTFSGMLIG